MRLTGIRLPLLAAVVSASVGLSLWASNRSYGQTVYVYPTSTTISLTSPYVLPRSYVIPSSYVFSNYIETAYAAAPSVSLLPTGYIETTYRRGLFGRRWIVERPVLASYASTYVPTVYSSAYLPTTYSSAYVPTTYATPSYYATTLRAPRYRATTYSYLPRAYYPTVYETAYNTSSDLCCDEVVVDAPVRPAPQSSAGNYDSSGGSKEVASSPMDESTISSAVDLPLPEETAKARSTVRGDQTKAGANRADTPPKPQAADAGDDDASKAAAKNAAGGGLQKNAPAQKAGGNATPKTKAAPVAPKDDLEDIDIVPGNDEPIRRDSMRPTYARVRGLDRRNILLGSVETDDGQPRPEVPVTIVNRNNTAYRKSGVSDAFGAFAIRVPDGQWSVRVTMPSGSTQVVRNITVNNGKIMDNLEAREVYNLIISY